MHSKACDDGNGCTTGEVCTGGKCAPIAVASFDSTIGSGVPGFKDGVAGSAQFHEPRGIVRDGSGWYLADRSNHRIRHVSATGVVSTVAGTGVGGKGNGAALEAGFLNPTGVVVLEGVLYVADTFNHVIRKVTPAGVVSTAAGSGNGGYKDGLAKDASFFFPVGVAFAPGGDLIIADRQNNVLRALSPAGEVRLFAGDGTPAAPSVHYHGLFAAGAKRRGELVPALGGRVAHNKRKGKRKAGATVGMATDPSGSKHAGHGDETFKFVGAAAVAYGDVEKEYSTKLTWAQCLRRTFLDALACPCGGRRQVIAVILQASEVEKILRHVKLWRENGDQDDSDIVAICGSPGGLVPAEDEPSDDGDGWDEPPPLDWAA